MSGHNVTAYTRREGDWISLARWGGGTMLACRCEAVREYHDGSLALVFRLASGRFVAALGILQTASIKAWASAGATNATEKIDAFRNAATYMSGIFLLGLVALLFLPETKGRPLPED